METARLARGVAEKILRGSSGAVEEYVALITAKSEPLVEETIHFPAVIELRHATTHPGMHFARAFAAATTADRDSDEPIELSGSNISF